MSEQVLLPCPFCGAGETRVDVKNYWTGMKSEVISATVMHHCPKSPLSSLLQLTAKTEAEAIALWNRRATPQPLQQDVQNGEREAMKEAIADATTIDHQGCGVDTIDVESLWQAACAWQRSQHQPPAQDVQEGHRVVDLRKHVVCGREPHAWELEKIRQKWNAEGTAKTGETYSEIKVVTDKLEAEYFHRQFGYSVKPLYSESTEAT